MTLELTERFIKGLKSRNLTLEMIVRDGWKYCGGDRGRHRRYFSLCFPSRDAPSHKKRCVCWNKIDINCYITPSKPNETTNAQRILVLGSCCIKKFLPKEKGSRTCEKCGEPHRNRIVNRCHACRVGICDGCNRDIPEKRKKCHRCRGGDICDECGCDISKGEKLCHKCKYHPCADCGCEVDKTEEKCYKCRMAGICVGCGRDIDKKYDKCYKCHMGGTCDECGCDIPKKYEKCYRCHTGGICTECGCDIDKKYEKCYRCHMGIQE